jgi:hypothetical protein
MGSFRNSVLLKLKMARLSAAFVAGCLFVITPGIVSGQEFAAVSVPLPVEIDGQPTHCRLYLKFETKSYNVPFDKFAAGPLDTAQTMFATAVDAIRKNDAAKFATVWTSPDQMKRNSQVTVALTDNSTDSWLKVARSNFDFDKLTVVAEVLVGSETIFIWDASTKAGIQRNAFYVGLDQKNQLRLSAVSSNSPVEPLILNAFVAAKMYPAVYKPISNLNVGYQYPIPLAGPGDAGAHPVFFEFDGAPMDFPNRRRENKGAHSFAGVSTERSLRDTKRQRQIFRRRFHSAEWENNKSVARRSEKTNAGERVAGFELCNGRIDFSDDGQRQIRAQRRSRLPRISGAGLRRQLDAAGVELFLRSARRRDLQNCELFVDEYARRFFAESRAVRQKYFEAGSQEMILG